MYNTIGQLPLAMELLASFKLISKGLLTGSIIWQGNNCFDSRFCEPDSWTAPAMKCNLCKQGYNADIIQAIHDHIDIMWHNILVE